MKKGKQMKAFWGCKFCQGRGCLACDGESKKEYARRFPDGPKPLLTVKVEDGKLAGPEAEVLREVFSAGALRESFAGKSPASGMQDVLEKLKESKARHGIDADPQRAALSPTSEQKHAP